MSVRDPEPDAFRHFEEPKGMAQLWYGLLAGVVAWKLQLMVIYALVPFACWNGLYWLIHVATVATIALSLSGAWVGLVNWRRVGRSGDTAQGGVLGRSRFMALSGLVLGLFFAFIILGQWLPNLMLGPCDGIA